MRGWIPCLDSTFDDVDLVLTKCDDFKHGFGDLLRYL